MRHRLDLISRFLFTVARDWLVVRELSTAVALSRKFWWYSVCMWCEDMPRKSLVVLQSYDAILDADAIAAHLLNRDAADVLWVEGFQHGELLGPQGYEARRRVANFLGALDTERVARDLIGLEPGPRAAGAAAARAPRMAPRRARPARARPRARHGGRPGRPRRAGTAELRERCAYERREAERERQTSDARREDPRSSTYFVTILCKLRPLPPFRLTSPPSRPAVEPPPPPTRGRSP